MRKIALFFVLALSGTAWVLHCTANNSNTNESDDASVHEPAEIRIDESDLDRRSEGPVTSYAEMLDVARPAVVSIASTRIVQVPDQRHRMSPMEEFLRRFYGLPAPNPEQEDSMQERRLPNALGSGVIVSANGYVLTNNHVIVDEQNVAADEILVKLSSGAEHIATVVGRDPQTDVALLKIDVDNLPYLPLANSDQLRVGDVVFAIGNPFGLDQTVSMGIVSATGRSRLGILGREGYEDFIQTDASINPGNSGGALVDARGRLVGLNTAIFSRTGGNIGIGFAVPVNMARFIMESLIEHGSVPRGFLGVGISDLTKDLAEAFDLAGTEGVLIENVMEGQAAAQAGVERGDIIVAVNGRPVADARELRLLIAQAAPGSSVDVTIIRDGAEMNVPIVLGSATSDDADAVEVFEGVSLAPLDDRLRQEFESREEEGLVVVDVKGNSPYRGSLRPGMIILEINDRKVTTSLEAQEVLQRGRINKLYISYRDERGYLALRIP